MNRLKYIIVASFILILSACASSGSPSPDANGPVEANPYAGRYVGHEVLVGGTFAIKIDIDNNGLVTVIDVDGRKARGKLEGINFVAKRTGIPQIFSGKITGNKISGTTKDNPYLGDGTFSATLK